jgi:uncharacterized membrane protein
MLVPFPIGLWVFSLICDIIYMTGHDAAWGATALYTMIGGTVGALLAALPGFIDYLSLKQRQVKILATWHLTINLSLVVLFSINILLRLQNPPGALLPFLLSVVGNLMLLVSGWLGGHLVYVHGLAVEPQPRENQ